jgi:hypothetical protein
VILERKNEDAYLGLVVNFMKLINPGVSKECHTLVCTEPHQWNLMLHGKLKCLQYVMRCHNTQGGKKNTNQQTSDKLRNIEQSLYID